MVVQNEMSNFQQPVVNGIQRSVDVVARLRFFFLSFKHFDIGDHEIFSLDIYDKLVEERFQDGLFNLWWAQLR